MRSLSFAVIAAICGCGCGSPPQETSSFLSWQAIAATLATQEGIAFDEEAAVEFQRQAVERCWRVEPLLECVVPVLPWGLGALYARAVPPDIKAAWDQGNLISSNEAMNRLVEEFQITGVDKQGPSLYEIRFAPTPTESNLHPQWFPVALFRMDRLAQRLNEEVDGLEVETGRPLADVLDRISWTRRFGDPGRTVRWEWWYRGVNPGSTFWDCWVPDDPEAEVTLQISGEAPSYASIDRCLEYIEAGRFPR